MIDLTKQADALYVDAIQKAGPNPSVAAILSPVAKVCLDAGVHAIQQLGADVLEQVGSAAADTAVTVLGPEVMSAVTSVATVAADAVAAVADIAPGLGAIISLYQSFASQNTTFDQAHIAVQCSQAVNVPVIGSGASGQPSLGNVFAFSPADTSVEKFPISSLGRALVAVTETDNSPASFDPENLFDSNQYHAAAVYDGVARDAYKLLIPGEWNVGVPLERRVLFASIRRAIGAQARGSESLNPIYLDMLVDEFEQGHLTGGFMVYLLGHYYRSNAYFSNYGDTGWVSDDPHGSNGFGDGAGADFCGSTGWTNVVNQIISLEGKWRETRGKIPCNPAAIPSPTLGALMSLLASRQPTSILNESGYTWAARHQILRMRASRLTSEEGHAAARARGRAAAAARQKLMTSIKVSI